MALTFSVRPRGRIKGNTAKTATVSNSGGDALFTTTIAHGLTSSDLVYVYSNREAYNGNWLVTVVTPLTFKIRPIYGDQNSPIDFIASATVTWYTIAKNTEWNSVHQPVVYQLTSTSWPTNSVDTARTVSSFSNSNGYTRLVLSGDIKASGSADALEQVEISGTPLLDGVYKILSWSSDVNFVIDLSYSASNIFTGGTVQYYYGNYHAIIRVYAGLPVGHRFRDFKPYELVAEFSQAPDQNNQITFNINEFVKKRLGILENNLLLDTLPNNTDAFCYVYIDFAESYDDANQYGTNDLNVSQFTGPFTTTIANPIIVVNASQPFKNQGEGGMNLYVPAFPDGPTQKFLTGFTRPVLFKDNYFDLSFIVDDNTMQGYYFLRRNYLAGVLLTTTTEALEDVDVGVYRHPIAQSSNLEDKIEMTLFNSTYGREIQLSETITIDVNSECSNQDFYVTWLNNLGGFDYWKFTGETTYGLQLLESRTQMKNIFVNWPNSFGEFADSMEKQTSRRTKDTVTLNSQYVDNENGAFDGLLKILESPLVQKINSVYDRRTILLGNSSRSTKVDNQKLLMLTVEARATDENPAQSL